MKKIILSLSLLAFAGFSAPSHANEEIRVDVLDEYTASLEMGGLVDATALEAARPGRPDYRRDDRRDGRRDGRWDGRRGPRGPEFPFFTTCYARNRRGDVFRVTGFGDSRMLQNQAMRECERSSWGYRSCRPMGCR